MADAATEPVAVAAPDARKASSALPPFGRPMLELFHLEPGYRNFNFGSYSAVPKPVLTKYQAYHLQVEARPDRWFRQDYRPLVNASRHKLAEYLHVNPADLVLVENLTSAINAVFRSFTYQKGDKMLMFSNEFLVTRNLLDWLAQQHGIEVLTLEVALPVVDDETTFLAPLRRLLDAHPGVRFATFAHVASTPGIVQPAKALTCLLHERGVTVAIDGAHAPGQIDLDVADVGADFYFGNCHKWLQAPRGCAFLWTSPRYQAQVVPTVISYEFDGADYLGRFLYVGTRDYCPMVALRHALEFREAAGDAAIKAYNHRLAWWAGTHLARVWGTDLLAPEAYVGAMVDVRLPLPSLQAATALHQWLLDTHDTFILVHEQGGRPYTRLSAQIFLEEADFVELGERVLAYVQQHATRE